MAAQPTIRVTDLSKRFVIRKQHSIKERLVKRRTAMTQSDEFWALRNVSIEIDEGHTVGLIGHNGSGKSTLLKMIGGILSPTSGYVERRGLLAALLELGAGFHGDLTGRENVYLNASILGLSRKEIDRYFDSIVDFSGIEQFIDTQVKFYSSGMYVRLAFAVAVHVDPDVLLVDEVLAVGDEPFQKKCLDKIKHFQHEGKTIVMVTHALDTVRQMCDKAILLDHGKVIVDGSPADAVRHFRAANAEHDADLRNDHNLRVSIGKVLLTDADGTPCSSLTPHDPVIVQFDVTAMSCVEDWAVSAEIETATGMSIYGVNSWKRGIAFDPIDGTRTIRFLFPSLPLSDGQYVVSVAVHPRTGDDYDRIDRAASFDVANESCDAGILSLDTRVTIH